MKVIDKYQFEGRPKYYVSRPEPNRQPCRCCPTFEGHVSFNGYSFPELKHVNYPHLISRLHEDFLSFYDRLSRLHVFHKIRVTIEIFDECIPENEAILLWTEPHKYVPKGLIPEVTKPEALEDEKT